MNPLNHFVVGECMGMCPLQEMNMREREGLLHVLEAVPGTGKDKKPKADVNRMVKLFCRSAAGNAIQESKNLRPPAVLLKTIIHLFDEVISRDDVPWTVIYDFLMDRLRSIRQDMVIQNVSKFHYINFLQPIVRFYAFASYRLCEENIHTFDPFINKTHLQECLKRLLNLYDDSDKSEEESTDISCEKRPYFEALYIISNMGNPHATTRALNLPRKWRKTNLIETALKLSLSYSNSNYVGACKVIKKLPTLLAAAASLHLPELRRNAFKTMIVAYNNKKLTYPVSDLKDSLLYDTDCQIIDDCKYYGLEIRDNGICFSKNSFDQEKAAIPSTHQQFIDQKLADTNLPRLILFSD